MTAYLATETHIKRLITYIAVELDKLYNFAAERSFISVQAQMYSAINQSTLVKPAEVHVDPQL